MHFTKIWVLDATERAIKTVAQSLISLWLIGDGIFDLLQVNWQQAFGVALGAGVLSFLMSVASVGSGNSASLVVENVKPK